MLALRKRCMEKARTVAIKVPKGTDPRRLQHELELFVEEHYGRISISSLRRKLGIKRLKSRIRITPAEEKAVRSLRKVEQARVCPLARRPQKLYTSDQRI